mgnify:FL=1
MKENGVEAAFLIRSAVDSRKQQVLEEVDAVTKAFGGTGTISSAYQAWQYKPKSELRPVMIEAYKEIYGKEPEICIIHGGLECGIFLGNGRIWIVYLADRMFWIFIHIMNVWILHLRREAGNS